MKSSRNYYFNTLVASEIGLEKSILMNNLEFWINTYKKNDINKHDNKYWVYASTKSLAEVYPFFSESSIARWLRELENEGYIVSTTKHNNHTYDRTKCYTIKKKYYDMLTKKQPEKNVSQNDNCDSTKMENQSDQNGKSSNCFPVLVNIKKDNETKVSPIPCSESLKEFTLQGQSLLVRTEDEVLVPVDNIKKSPRKSSRPDVVKEDGQGLDIPELDDYTKKLTGLKKNDTGYCADSLAFLLSLYLVESIKKRNPYKKQVFRTWPRHIDELLAGGEKPEWIKRVIEICETDQFYGSIVMSMDKFKIHYPSIKFKYKLDSMTATSGSAISLSDTAKRLLRKYNYKFLGQSAKQDGDIPISDPKMAAPLQKAGEMIDAFTAVTKVEVQILINDLVRLLQNKRDGGKTISFWDLCSRQIWKDQLMPEYDCYVTKCNLKDFLTKYIYSENRN